MRSGTIPFRVSYSSSGPVRDRADRAAVLVAERLELRLELVAHALVVLLRDDALWLAPGDVEEEPAVVAALAPGHRLRPIDHARREPGRLGWLLEQREVALLPQPLVDADAAVDPLRAVVRDDEDGGLVVGEAQQPPHLLVDAAVVVEHRVLELVVGLVQAVLGIEVAPERVVDAVGAHLDHEEEIPRPRLQEMLRNLEPALGHRLDVAQHARLVLGPEVRHVDHVLADEPLDLLLERGRVRVLAARVRREEARDHDPVHRRYRVGLRDAEHDDLFALRAEEIPHARHPDRARVGEAHRVVAVVLPVAEAVEAQDARAPRGGHHRPRGHRDRRVAAPQHAEAAALGEAPDVWSSSSHWSKTSCGAAQSRPMTRTRRDIGGRV